MCEVCALCLWKPEDGVRLPGTKSYKTVVCCHVGAENQTQAHPLAKRSRALNLEAITPAPFNVHPHLIQPITSCSIHGPTLSNPYNFSHGLHQDAQALSLISRITFSRPTTCAHGSTKISAPRDSWGSDQGPQCSNSSHEEPQLQLIVVL